MKISKEKMTLFLMVFTIIAALFLVGCSGSGSEPTFSVTIASGIENGEISADPNTDVEKGVTVTITVKPETDYKLKPDSLKVVPAKGAEIIPVFDSDGDEGATYTFDMPAANVVVHGEFIDVHTTEVTIQFDSNSITKQEIDLTFNEENDLEYGGVLEVTIDSEFDDIDAWFLNSGLLSVCDEPDCDEPDCVDIHEIDDNTYKLFINEECYIGRNTLTVIVFIDDIPYSCEIIFRVVKEAE
jgi:hypothetical protein